MKELSTPLPLVAPAADGLRTLSRSLELLALFGALPLALRWNLVAVPRLVVLALVASGCLAVLRRDPTFDWHRRFSFRGLGAARWTLVVRAVAVGAGVVAAVLLLAPEALFTLPARGSVPWLVGLALYPLLSAWPQEVVYRAFFFHRYGALFPGRWTLVAVNAAAFGWLHVVYPNLVAPLLSVPAGLLLALTYRRTGTLGPAWVEHSVYGLLLFGLGLGQFFLDSRV